MKNKPTNSDTNHEPNQIEIDAKELATVNGGYESQADQDYRTWYHQQGPGKNS